MKPHSQSGTKPQQTSLDAWPNGVGGIEGSNTIFFIPRQAIPKGKIVTYGRFVVDIRPKKMRLTEFASLWVAA
jgi:hypothetical protein